MDPEKDQPQDRDGEARDAASAAGAPKPPPWQVPKPELRPELQDPGLLKPDGQSGQPSPIIDPFARERERDLNAAAARKKRSQRRTVVVGLGVTALLAGTITAIVASNEQEPDYAQVCFNDETG